MAGEVNFLLRWGVDKVATTDNDGRTAKEGTDSDSDPALLLKNDYVSY